jgi:hypothetical protein
MVIEILASEMVRGDVMLGMDPTPRNTVRSVDAFGPLVIIDFEDGSATAPLPNGTVQVTRAKEES